MVLNGSYYNLIGRNPFGSSPCHFYVRREGPLSHELLVKDLLYKRLYHQAAIIVPDSHFV